MNICRAQTDLYGFKTRHEGEWEWVVIGLGRVGKERINKIKNIVHSLKELITYFKCFF